MTIVSNQTSHSPATGVDECAEVPDEKVPGGNLEASPDIYRVGKRLVASVNVTFPVSGDAPRVPPGISPSGTIPHVDHPRGEPDPRHIANIPSFALTDESPDMSEATAPESPSQQPFGIPYNLPAMTTEVDYLNTLELTLVEEHIKTEQIENQLQQLIELLNPALAASEPAHPEKPLLYKLWMKIPHRRCLWAEVFNLYFSIAGRAFQDKQARISWALTFFKTGQAASFADQILRTQSRTGKPYFTNWSAFELEFKKHFTPRQTGHRHHTIGGILVVSRFRFSGRVCRSVPGVGFPFGICRRGSDSVDDSQVQEGSQQILVDDGIDDGPPPAFDDLEAWIEVAQRVVEARETSKDPRPSPRLQGHCPPPHLLGRSTTRLDSLSLLSTLTLNPPRLQMAWCQWMSTRPAARPAYPTFLTVEEKEELLYGLMTDLDMSENVGAELSGEEEVFSEQEDFAKRDE
ncbi:hypothetical protein M422DRAFT_243941 [Sphaerobolus stellatus SS14]|nr:hypothetical protein M422DRAFT_243941 [Sphaerobolus stellatus SS14]